MISRSEDMIIYNSSPLLDLTVCNNTVFCDLCTRKILHAPEAVDRRQGWPDEDIHFHNKHRDVEKRRYPVFVFSGESSILPTVHSSVEQSEQTINKRLANIDPGTISTIDTI